MRCKGSTKWKVNPKNAPRRASDPDRPDQLSRSQHVALSAGAARERLRILAPLPGLEVLVDMRGVPDPFGVEFTKIDGERQTTIIENERGGQQAFTEDEQVLGVVIDSG